jgi:hypothetical protein
MRPLFFFVAILLCAVSNLTDAAPAGLEVSDSSSVPVMIGRIEDAEKLGLSREIIEARVNTVLRKNGLKPVDGFNTQEPRYVVSVSTFGDCVRIDLVFLRMVTYRDGSKDYHIGARTWDYTTSVVSPRATAILDWISNGTEYFVNEFLKANGK